MRNWLRNLAARTRPTYNVVALATRQTSSGIVVGATVCSECGCLIGNRPVHDEVCPA